MSTLLAPVAGGHQTIVAEFCPLIPRASTGAPTVVLSAADVLGDGHVESVPLDPVCVAPGSDCDAVLAEAAAGAVVAALAATAPNGTAIPIVIASALSVRASLALST